jgi:uncharacterized protein (DUF433 family)
MDHLKARKLLVRLLIVPSLRCLSIYKVKGHQCPPPAGTGAPLSRIDFRPSCCKRRERNSQGIDGLNASGTLFSVDYTGIITIEDGKRSGKPCIRGMRITVQDVLEYLAGGMSEDEILTDISELTREDIRACLAFAADRERKLFVAAT